MEISLAHCTRLQYIQYTRTSRHITFFGICIPLFENMPKSLLFLWSSDIHFLSLYLSPYLSLCLTSARGLDIKSVRVVINYEIARTIDAHVHRIGRTGRAGQKGVAYTLLLRTDNPHFAGELVRNLEGASQQVPQALIDIAMQVRGFSQPTRFLFRTIVIFCISFCVFSRHSLACVSPAFLTYLPLESAFQEIPSKVRPRRQGRTPKWPQGRTRTTRHRRGRHRICGGREQQRRRGRRGQWSPVQTGTCRGWRFSRGRD